MTVDGKERSPTATASGHNVHFLSSVSPEAHRCDAKKADRERSAGT